MGKYIEEYLVALGFDLNSEQGKEYLQMCNEIDKKQKEAEKSGQAAADQTKKLKDLQQAVISGNKQEADSADKLLESRKKLSKDPQRNFSQETKVSPVAKESPSEVPPAESFTKEEQPGPPGPKTSRKEKPSRSPVESGTTEKPKATPGKTKAPRAQPTNERKESASVLGGLEKPLKQLAGTWVELEHGNIFSAFRQGAGTIRSFETYLSSLNTSFGTTNTRAGTLKRTLSDMFGAGGTAKEAASLLGSAGEDAAGAGAAASGTAIGAVGAAAGITAAVALTAKAIWNMSDGLAQAGVNVELMSRKLWITDSAAWQLNGTLSAMGKTTADLNDIAISPTLNKQFKAVQQVTKGQNTEELDKAKSQWTDEVGTPWAEINAKAGMSQEALKAKLSEFFAPIFSGVLKPMNWLEDQLGNALGTKSTGNKAPNSASAYAPQNYSYTTQNQGAKVTYAPNITVYANSDNHQDVSDAVTGATQQSFQNAVITNNVQGLNR